MITALACILMNSTPALTIEDLAKQVDEKRLRATVEKLASWPNRNTNNPTLTEAAEWIASEFRNIPGIEVEIMKYEIQKGQRVPETKEVVQVIATLLGTDPTLKAHRIAIGGHLDTINMGPEGISGKAPGANDDASGVAAALECARILSQQKFKRTLHFIAFSGEEQGLLGSTALAKRAKAESWTIDAVLSNDMIANSQNKRGDKEANAVRVFSEETETHAGRELARVMEFLQRESGSKHRINLVFRRDRFGRGGDHTPFNREGFTAIRVVEQHEEYSHQHTDQDLPEFMDWRYHGENTRLNLRMLSHFANAEAAPTQVRVDRRQGYESRVTWKGNAAQEYRVYWRLTTSPTWQGATTVKGLEALLPKYHKDDYVFAVSALGGIPVVAE